MQLYTKLLSNGDWKAYNSFLAKKIGINEAIMLSELCYKYEYWSERNEITDDGYFYLTIEDCFNDTALTRYNQETAIRKLLKLNLIEIKKLSTGKNISPVRHFKLLESHIVELLQHTLLESNNVNSWNPAATDITPTDITPTDIGDSKTESNPKIIGKDKNNNSMTLGKNLNPKSYKAIMNFISNLNLLDSTKDNLKHWYEIVGKPTISVDQLKIKLNTILDQINNNEELLNKSISIATERGWKAFYMPNSYQMPKNNAIRVTPQKTAKLEELSDEIF